MEQVYAERLQLNPGGGAGGLRGGLKVLLVSGGFTFLPTARSRAPGH
jgi:hypothetical protein